MIIVLALLLAPVAFVYLDIDFGGNTGDASRLAGSSNPMKEIALIRGMIPGGGKSPEYVSLSSWGRDIFVLVEEEETETVTNVATRTATFFLSGIMTFGLVRSAIINDEIVTEGAVIDRYIVESILEETVVLSRNHRRLVLSLSQ